MDMVLGVDIHFEMVPTPAPVPTPIPNPFVGMVFDPAGLLVGQVMSLAMAMVSGTPPLGPVLINGFPATTVGTATVDAYGDLRNITGTRTACPFRWPGQYEDAETGLYYNRFRYYDPLAGRYVSRDPIRVRGGLELYSYTSDTSGRTDPFGLMDCARAKKQAQKTIEEAQAGKIRLATNYHGRLPSNVEADILSSPEKVFFSEGQGECLAFYKDGNVVVTETGSRRGQVVTSYGDKGPRGSSGAAVLGGSPTDPGLPITPAAITGGTIPAPGGTTLPPATEILP